MCALYAMATAMHYGIALTDWQTFDASAIATLALKCSLDLTRVWNRVSVCFKVC